MYHMVHYWVQHSSLSIFVILFLGILVITFLLRMVLNMDSTTKSDSETIIASTINDIRHIKKKKSDKKCIVHEASKQGLNKAVTTTLLGQMVSKGVLGIKKGSYHVISDSASNKKCREGQQADTSSCTMKPTPSFIEPSPSVSSTPDRQTTTSHVAQVPSGSTDSLITPDLGIYQAFSQLSRSVAELHALITKEREVNHQLQVENLNFRRKLGLVGGSNQTTTEVFQNGTKENEQKDQLNDSNENNKENELPIVCEDILNNKETTKTRKSRKKRNKIRQNKRDEQPNDAVQCCNSSEDVLTTDAAVANIQKGKQGNKSTADGHGKECNPAIETTNTAKQNKTTVYESKSNNTMIPKTNHQVAPPPTCRNAKTTTIVCGDSMVKNVKTWKMKQNLARNEMIIVKSFPGATVRDMGSYCKPAIDKEPTRLILHCGTNDLRSSKSDVDISTEIITLAKSIETHGVDVIISGLIARGDSHEDKRRKTNLILQDMCNEEHISFTDHDNIKADKHLNRSQLHLNSYGDEMLERNLVSASRR